MEYRGKPALEEASVRRLANILTSAKVSSSADLKLAARIMDKTVEESFQQGQDPKRVCATLGGFPVAVSHKGVACLSVKDAEAFKISPSQRQYITLKLLKTAGGLFLTAQEAKTVERATDEFAERPSPAFWKICRVFWEAATRKRVAVSLSLVISFALAYITLSAKTGELNDTLRAARSLFSNLDSARIRAGEGLSSFMERLSNWVKPDVQKLLRNLQDARASTDQKLRDVIDALASTESEHRQLKEEMDAHNSEADRFLNKARAARDSSFWTSFIDLLTVPIGVVGGVVGGAAIGLASKPGTRNISRSNGGGSEPSHGSSLKNGTDAEAVAQIVSVLNGAKGPTINKEQVVNLVKRTFEQQYTAGTLPSHACGARAVPLALVGAPEDPKVVCLDHEAERRMSAILTPNMMTMLSLAVAEKASHVLADTTAERAKLRRLAKEAFQKPVEKFKELVMAIYDIGKRNKIKLTVGFVGLLAVALIAKSNHFQNTEYLQRPLQRARRAWDDAIEGASDLRSKISSVFTAPQSWIIGMTHGEEKAKEVKELQEGIRKNEMLHDTVNEALKDSLKSVNEQRKLTELALGKRKDAESVLAGAERVKGNRGLMRLAGLGAGAAAGTYIANGRGRLNAEADAAQRNAAASRLQMGAHRRVAQTANARAQHARKATAEATTKADAAQREAAASRLQMGAYRRAAQTANARAQHAENELQKLESETEINAARARAASTLQFAYKRKIFAKEMQRDEPEWLRKAEQEIMSPKNDGRGRSNTDNVAKKWETVKPPDRLK